MNQVNIQPQAQEEAEQAAVWYETQQTSLGVEFILELDKELIVISQLGEEEGIVLHLVDDSMFFVYAPRPVACQAVL